MNHNSSRTLLVRALCASLVGFSAAQAQDLSLKAKPQEKPIALVNATIHPVSGPDIAKGFVVFDKGVISRVAAGDIPSVAGEKPEIIDCAGKHVYPGLLGANTVIGLTEVEAARATRDYDEVGGITPEVRAAVSINPDSNLIPVARSNGVLSVAVIPMGGAITGRVSVIALDGWTSEDITIRDDVGVVVNWPSLRISNAWWQTKSESEQMEDARKAIEVISGAFDQASAYAAARAADPTVASDIRWDAMRPAIEGKTRVFIHADELEQIESACSWAEKRKLHAVIIGGLDAPLAAETLKRTGFPVIVTGVFRTPKRSDSPYDDAFTLPARLEAAGVSWCLATGGGSFDAPHERNLPYHAAMAVAYGLDPAVAIRAITLSPAQALGVADRLGTLEQGKDATLIITDGSPLEMTTTISRAFIRGRDVDLSNKQTKLNEKYREKYRRMGIIAK